MSNTDEGLMSIGAFSQRTRLSPKALRLYDELCLLTPARVDESSGYRFYDVTQLERAWLVAALRRLDMPLAEIKAILELEAAPAAERIAAYWASVEVKHDARRDLAAHLVDRVNGKRSVMFEVAIREIPARSLLCLKRNVVGSNGAWALGKEFIGVMREHPMPRLDPPAGGFFCIYWAEVSEDSDGPLEWCRPVPEDRAQELAQQVPELTLRSEPAHREAFVHLGRHGQVEPAQWVLVSDSLQIWSERHGRRPSGLGIRTTYTVDRPAAETQGPLIDFAVPLAA